MNDDGGVVLVEVVGGHESKLVLDNVDNSSNKNTKQHEGKERRGKREAEELLVWMSF